MTMADRWLAYIIIGAIRMQGDEYASYSKWSYSTSTLMSQAFIALRRAYA